MGEPHITVTADISFEFAGLQIGRKTFTMTTPLPGLVNAQAADTALQTEIGTYLADVATALLNAINSAGDSDTAVQAIADDLNAQAARLVAADPLNPPATPAGSAPPLPG